MTNYQLSMTATSNTRSALVKALHKSLCGIALPILLASCGSGGSTPEPPKPPTTTLLAPALANATAAQTYRVGTAITPFSFDNSAGGAVGADGCSGTLPAGLNLTVANNTCQIAGTPTEPSAEATYTITATNTAGSDMATISITVNPAAPMLENAPEQNYPINEPITTPFAFTNGGGDVQASGGCTIRPTLPLGLTFTKTTDNQTCQITGTPLAESPRTTYTVTATNTAGSDMATISITVNPAAPMLENAPEQNYPINEPITTPFAFTNGGGDVQASGGCTIRPTLPLGLTFTKTTDNQTCQIAGTPLAESPRTTYTVTATNISGPSEATVVISVFTPVVISMVTLENLGDETTPQDGDILTLRFTTTGPTTNFDPQVSIGGQIVTAEKVSGTEDRWMATLIVGANFMQSETEGFAIIVIVPNGKSPTENLAQSTTVTTVQNTPTPLSLEDTTETFLLAPALALDTLSYRFEVDQEIAPIVFVNEGGAVKEDGCAPASGATALPIGLMIEVADDTCQIVGTPGVTKAGESYTIAATNTSGEDEFTLNIAIVEPLPSCTSLDTVEAEGYPINTLTFEQRMLYLIGNHSNEAAEADFLLKHKGSNTYQAIAIFDTQGATDDYNGQRTQLTLATDDNNQTTQLWVADDQGMIRGANNPINITEQDKELSLYQGNPGTNTNHIQLITGSTYSFSFTFDTTTTAFTGTEQAPLANVGTLNIQECVPEVITATSPNLASIDNPISLTTGLGFAPIVFENSGAAATGCSVDTSTTPALPSGLSVTTTTDGTCQITGTAGATMAQATYKIVATSASMETSTATVVLSIDDLPTTPTACSDLEQADDTTGYPLTVTGHSARLYIRGNLSNEKAHPNFILRHKGSDTYQAAFTLDSTLAATDYDPTNTQFKVASDDESLSTQFNVIDSTIPDISQTPLTFFTAHDVDKGDGTGLSNSNPIALKADGTYIFTLVLSAEDPADGAGSGTLKIDDCTQPNIENQPDTVLSFGQTEVNLSFANTGGFIQSCSIEGTPPMGLSLSASPNAQGLCAIEGTASMASTETTYTITATNTKGMDMATITLTVSATSLPILAPPNTLPTLVHNQPIASGSEIIISNTQTNSRGAIGAGTCTFVDNQGTDVATLFGLTISTDANRCLIAGTPSSEGDLSLMIKAATTGGDESSILNLGLKVNPIPRPILTAPDTLPTLILNQPIASGSEIIISNTQTDSLGAIGAGTCTFVNQGAEVTTLLGLTISTDAAMNQCLIAGTPDTEGNSTLMIQAATVGGDDSDILSLDITVNPIPTPILTAPAPNTLPTLVRNQPIAPGSEIIISNTQADTLGAIEVNTCTFVNDQGTDVATLFGLTISTDTNRCLIAGTPDTRGGLSLMIKAANASGNSSNILSLNLTVNPAAPVLVDAGEQTYFTGRAIPTLTFTNNGGNIQADANGCTVSPALPASLVLTNTTDNQTCQITGVPAAAINSNNLYTITGRNISGPSMATVTIVVNQSSSVEDLTLLNSSGFPTNFSANNVYSAIGDFTDKMVDQAANAVGAKLTWSTTLGITTLNFTTATGASVWALTDVPTTRDLSDYAAGFIAFEVMVPDYGSTPSLLFQTNANGDSACTNCMMDLGKVGDGFWQTIVVNIAGLTGFDPMTTTSPFGLSPEIASQTAQNALSLMVQNIRWTNNEPNVPDAPVLTSLGAQVYTVMDTIDLDIPGGSGGAPTQCSADPILPTGLTLTTTSTSCKIAGMPAATANTQTHTITASNLGGKSSVDVMITVNPQAPQLR